MFECISKMIKDCSSPFMEFNNKRKFKLVYFLITLSFGITVHSRKKFIGSNFNTVKMNLFRISPLLQSREKSRL